MPRPILVTSSRALSALAARLSAGAVAVPLTPVIFSTGIAAWFALPADPPPALGWAAAGLALSAALLAGRAGLVGRLGCLALAVFAAGFAAAELRAARVAAPVLDWRYYGAIQGRVVAIDRSVSDAVRITLDHVVLERVAPERTPEKVRVALHGAAGQSVPAPGDIAILTGHLSPPGGPVAPGGFDFARLAWFDRLGAVGYTRSPVLRLAAAPGGPNLGKTRLALSRAIQARIDGPPGALAAAVATGDRSALTRREVEALRASNLSHLLAISGLHLGLVAGVVFGAARLGLAAVPAAGLRLPGKKIAAALAIAAAAVYLALSGGNVATQRAFVMVACLFGAVLIDRRALSLRALALAAMLILAVTPESLREAGFRMSFAATTLLVAVFSGAGGRWLSGLPAPLAWVGALALSSAVAGAATAPIAAAQFNRIAEYGYLANLLAVPVMGTLVIPGVVLAACLAPLGLAAPGLWMLETGCRWILAVAATVAGLEGAVIGVPTPPGAVLPVLALAGIWAVLVPGRARGLAALPAATCLALWATAERPAVLVADDASLVGRLGPEGRALSKPRGSGFVAGNWLEDDGDFADQASAAVRPGFTGDRGARRTGIDGRPLWHLTGAGAADRAAAVCHDRAILVVAAEMPGPAPGDCLLFDLTRLAETGALAIDETPGGGIVITPARRLAGDRRWTPWMRRP